MGGGDHSGPSAQQPFPQAHSQPISAAAQPVSPPTKQSLKNWWKGFRPPQKQEAPGEDFAILYARVSSFRSRIANCKMTRFNESQMSEVAPVTAGNPFLSDPDVASQLAEESSDIGMTSREQVSRLLSPRKAFSAFDGSDSSDATDADDFPASSADRMIIGEALTTGDSFSIHTSPAGSATEYRDDSSQFVFALDYNLSDAVSPSWVPRVTTQSTRLDAFSPAESSESSMYEYDPGTSMQAHSDGQDHGAGQYSYPESLTISTTVTESVSQSVRGASGPGGHMDFLRSYETDQSYRSESPLHPLRSHPVKEKTWAYKPNGDSSKPKSVLAAKENTTKGKQAKTPKTVQPKVIRKLKSLHFDLQPFSRSAAAKSPARKRGRLCQFMPNVHLKSLFSASSISIANKEPNIVEPPTGIFGVSLRQSISYANVAISLVDADGNSYIYGYVPIVVAKCGVYLKEKATEVEGIFRMAGSEKRIKELKAAFDSPDRYGKGLDWAGYTVHDAANVLRRYLNQLPEPIVPLDLYDRFREPLRGHTLQAVGDSDGPQFTDNFDVERAIRTYQQLITELPPLNRQLLLYILDLLAVFASKSDKNRMNSPNLAAIFQPGMLTHPAHDMAPQEYRLSQDVLIFLIENQDHFLIGMRGTAADEQTVQEVQRGSTPPVGTPTSSRHGRSKTTTVARSSSNASAGAESIRKFGGVRRNVSTSSRHSRQSNGAPSPVSPAYNASLSSASGLQRSNTVPSKRSPGMPPNRFRMDSGTGSPSPLDLPPTPSAAPRGLSPAAAISSKRSVSPSSADASQAALTITSQDLLLGHPGDRPAVTPSKEKNLTGFFQRSPTGDLDKKQPNKLRKKRMPGSANPSAHSSTNSLSGQQGIVGNPATFPVRESPEQNIPGQPHLETISTSAPQVSNTEPTPVLTDQARSESAGNPVPLAETTHSSEKTLKPLTSPTSSMHSRSSFNDMSDPDRNEYSGAQNEQAAKKSRWRLSRRADDNHYTSPKKEHGQDSSGLASTSSFGSTPRPMKSFTGDSVATSMETKQVDSFGQFSNEGGSADNHNEDKKGPLGWIKKMREKRDEKEKEKVAEKERNKSPSSGSQHHHHHHHKRDDKEGVAEKEQSQSPPAGSRTDLNMAPPSQSPPRVLQEVKNEETRQKSQPQPPSYSQSQEPAQQQHQPQAPPQVQQTHEAAAAPTPQQ